MKIRNLHLGKVMRAALFVLLLTTAGTTKSFAQTRVATLQHGDEITAFYGTNALSQAHAAAESGDVITLSSGTFSACDITKAITLRGAGCYEDTLTGVQPTYISGSVYANITEATTYFLTIEGIWFENSFYHNVLNNPWFNKCDFASFNSTGNGIMQNATFVNCRIRGNYYNANSTNIFMINSLLLSGVYNVSATCSLTLNNSIMYYYSTTNSSDAAFVAYNSILINCAFGFGCSLYNCLTLNSSSVGLGSPFMVNCLNYSINSGSTVFVGWISPGNNGFIDQSFELKQSFINSFVGTDGTQIGIYGGNIPYNKLPAYIRTQVNVASQSTEDGMLNVEVEIIDEDE